MEDPRWTLDELTERVDAALAVGYDGQPSGRVRAVPDRRAIRWYTTIGLIDRPAAHRGRTALYGPRHLLQLVAVKRLQARGLPLVAIQQELAGATDTQLARVARLPAATPVGAASSAVVGPGAGGEAVPGEPRVPNAARGAAARTTPARGSARQSGFWREQPAAVAAGAAPAIQPAPGDGEVGEVATLHGVRLGEGATLLLEPGRELESADLRAILEAARPLLAALRARGLGGSAPRPPWPTSGG
ncbi:MAG TPA: MerR family transcriptional regulator [Actinomycetota bacterium]|nr:MerR family transcriptional regulator [Actinomycetota bacterium]